MEKRYKNSISLLLHWAGKDKYWLYLAILFSVISGLCTMVPYYGIYRLMEAGFQGNLTTNFVIQNALIIAVAMVIRFIFFGSSGVASHKGAYGALFKVRCMVVNHMAKVPLGALNERSTGNIKTVLNEDIEKLELFLAHNLPELVYYMIGPIAVFFYLLTVNIPLALVSLVPLIVAMITMAVLFRNMDEMMGRANKSIMSLNSIMIEYISGMKLIKAYNMGSKSFQKFSSAIQEENEVWTDLSKKMGPPYAVFVVIIECGMLVMVPLGGMFFLNGSITASIFLLFAYVGSLYLTEIRPLQELGSNFAEVLTGVVKVKEILDYETLLQNVAIVFQKTFLTRDSVFENIRMGSNASLDEVREAAKKAQIDDFIMSLPDGYDTKVGSFGSRFSGGEKQRIAIARAILKNAPILILDEATSAADPENQVEIDKAIENLCKGKTVIIVAHRLGAIKICDRVAVVENHTITCCGTHEEVRKNNAYYRKAWSDYEQARAISYQLEGGNA